MEWHDKVKKGHLKGEKVLLPYSTTSILSMSMCAQVHTYSDNYPWHSGESQKSILDDHLARRGAPWYVNYWLVSSDTSFIEG